MTRLMLQKPEELERPVPDMSLLRRRKERRGYRGQPFNASDPRSNEQLVRIGEYGIAGQPYYSRPNAMTGAPISGVPREMYLRRSVAETLAAINDGLRDPFFTRFFMGEVELYLEEALRPAWLQEQLWQLFLEELIRRGFSQEIAEKRRVQLIAAPSTDTSAPHQSGGAFDCVLRYRQPTRGWVRNSMVHLGFDDAELGERLNPDYYELSRMPHPIARRNRRALAAIMSGRVFGQDTGFTFNPNEVFHFDRGDLLWSMCTGQPAYYGAAQPPV